MCVCVCVCVSMCNDVYTSRSRRKYLSMRNETAITYTEGETHRVWESCNVEPTATGRRHQAAVYSVTRGLLCLSVRIISAVNLRQLDRSTHRWEVRNRVEVLVNCIHVGQDGFCWHSLLHAVLQVRFP